MNTADDNSLHATITACALLAACATSVYAALLGVMLLLALLLLQGVMQGVVQGVVQRIVQGTLQRNFYLYPLLVFISGGALAHGLSLWSADLQAAFTHIVAFACIAACVHPPPIAAATITATQKTTQTGSAQILAPMLVLLIATGAAVELAAYGTLPVDREIGFGGALRAFEIRIFDTGIFPWLAHPAGAVLILALLLAVVPRRKHKNAAHTATSAPNTGITSPHPGRRVRVTGHIR